MDTTLIGEVCNDPRRQKELRAGGIITSVNCGMYRIRQCYSVQTDCAYYKTNNQNF